MGWSLQNITEWSRHAYKPTHTVPKTGENKFVSLKIFFSRTETGRVKQIMVL
jgi:hypothetical protein